MYASQWFLTLFTAKFPLYMVFHIIDLLLCEVGNDTSHRPAATHTSCVKYQQMHIFISTMDLCHLRTHILQLLCFKEFFAMAL